MTSRLLHLCLLCSALICLATVQIVDSAEGTYVYQAQPPPEPPCNPYTNRELRLECTAVGPLSSRFRFNWFHSVPTSSSATECTTRLLNDGTNVVIFRQASTINTGQRRVRSQIRVQNLSPSDVGLYWCQMNEPNVPLLPSSPCYLAEPQRYGGLNSCSLTSGLSVATERCGLADNIEEVQLAVSNICGNSSLSQSSVSSETFLPASSPPSKSMSSTTLSWSVTSTPVLPDLPPESPSGRDSMQYSSPLLSLAAPTPAVSPPTLLSTPSLPPPLGLPNPQGLPLTSLIIPPRETTLPSPVDRINTVSLASSPTSDDQPDNSPPPPSDRVHLMLQLYVAVAVLVLTTAAMIVLCGVTICVCIKSRHRKSVAPRRGGRSATRGNTYSVAVIERPAEETEHPAAVTECPAAVTECPAAVTEYPAVETCYPYEVPTPSVLNSGRQFSGSQSDAEASSIHASHEYEEVYGVQGEGRGLQAVPVQLNRAYRSCVMGGMAFENTGFHDADDYYV